jgi:uncharacterized protein involved in cysteine biosynthesis
MPLAVILAIVGDEAIPKWAQWLGVVSALVAALCALYLISQRSNRDDDRRVR